MKLNKHHTGLTSSKVLENRKLYGDNQITITKKDNTLELFIEKFKDPLIIIMLVALTLSFIASTYQIFNGETAIVFLEPVGILLAITLATGVGFWFELSAKRKFDILNQEEEAQPVKVMRNGNYCAVTRNEIVVSDIVILETGDEVPADGILLESVSLLVNESVLTGETIAIKSVNPDDVTNETAYPCNLLMRGTTVTDGHAVMKVTKVGNQTEYGKVYQGVQIENNIKTPLNKQLDKLSDIITKFSYIIATFVIIGRSIMLFQMIDGPTSDTGELIGISKFILDSLMIAVTIIVVAVPEGLPMSVSLSLALSMRRMLTTNNLVRKMHACETMGAATVICTDKTGTLTQNLMSVAEVYNYATGVNQDSRLNQYMRRLLYKSIAVNSTANLDFSQKKTKGIGNQTEAATLIWLYNLGVDYRFLREEAEIVVQSSFSTERKYMGTQIHTSENNTDLLMIKGAPEIILKHCNKIESPEGAITLNNEWNNNVNQRLESYQNRGMRTIAYAYKEVPRNTQCFDQDSKLISNSLTFLCIIALSDPIRNEVPQAIKECHDAGIDIKIVTGDNTLTAKEIGKQIGLITPDESSISGPDFAALSDEEAISILNKIKIMSRARPMDKQRLVKLLQSQDEVVAVTGDGTNDAPALKQAQIGLSMGDGTSVAKHASAITILDNSFNSINKAVLWGRSLYRNIQRFIMFQLTINIAACIIVTIGSFTGMESPLTVTQMLWVNLIMDTFAAMALASLPPESDVMQQKPRDKNANIITRKMTVTFLHVGLAMVIFQTTLMYIFRTYDITSMTDLFHLNTTPKKPGITVYESSLFFTIFIMLQFWNMFNAKAFNTSKSALHHLHECKSFILILLIIVFVQILIVNFGGRMFNTTPISLNDWLTITALTSIILLSGETFRFINFLKSRKNTTSDK